MDCGTCYNIDVDKLIYQTKYTLDKLAISVSGQILNGYSCDKRAFDKSQLLSDYLRILQKYQHRLSLGGEMCVKEKEFQAFAERVRKLTTNCSDVRLDQTKDSTEVQAWIANNPFCVSREKWEKIAYSVCQGLRLEIKSEEVKCNLTFEIIRNLIPCDIVIAISTYKEACDLKLKVNRDEIQCKIDFDILRTETNCNIDFKTYKKLINCNLSFDIIKTVYENECSFEIDGDVVLLATPLNTYPLNELKFSGKPNLQILKNYKVDTKKSKYLKNPQAFINKLKSDYLGTS